MITAGKTAFLIVYLFNYKSVSKQIINVKKVLNSVMSNIVKINQIGNIQKE